MKKIKINPKKAKQIIEEIYADPMGGWIKIPTETDIKDLALMKIAANTINENSKYLVCIGIGGSYLGHKAVIEAIKPKSPTKMLYAGNSFSSDDILDTLNEIGNDDFSILVISKSGTTLEPAIAFRIFKKKLIEKYGDFEAKKRIFTITDKNQGILRDETVANNYKTFPIPKNIGGRYSVLSPVGILPMMVAGIDVMKLLQGAKECLENELNEKKLESSSLIRYAFTRHELYKSGTKIEVLASFEPRMVYFNEWWKQLFGESEGKNHGGLFPASVIYSTDLHSMGQYMQDGQRQILETFINFEYTDKIRNEVKIPKLPTKVEIGRIQNIDTIEMLEKKSLHFINQKVLEATISAHDSGGISTILISVSDDESHNIISERSLGFLIFFFEMACAISAKLNNVNPFDQPGVEIYKKKMHELLETN